MRAVQERTGEARGEGRSRHATPVARAISAEPDALEPGRLSRKPADEAKRIAANTGASIALPAGLFLALQQTEYRIDHPEAKYLIIGPVAWATVSVIVAVDPLLKEKISTVEDVLGMFLGFGRSETK